MTKKLDGLNKRLSEIAKEVQVLAREAGVLADKAWEITKDPGNIEKKNWYWYLSGSIHNAIEAIESGEEYDQ